MKKTIIALMLFIAVASNLQAQTYDEWFRQKRTKKKYLVQQIAALKVYIDYAQKGYKIAKEGLGNIGRLTGSEFDFHSKYFNSLESVNPNVRSYASVAKIISLQANMMSDYSRNQQWLSSNDFFTDVEIRYINRVFSRLMDNCDENLEELINLTTDGNLKMTDDDRLSRIDKLYTDMQDNHTFFKKFSNETRTLAISRERESRDVLTSRALYGKKDEQ